MRVERIVLDTNVLISAALSRLGKPFACLDWVLDNATLIVSRELLEELETRLTRPKFSKYVDDSRRRAFVSDVGLSAVQVELSGTVTVCRDPDDNKLLEIALVGRADCRVTGDQDLLILDSFQGIPILTPDKFYHDGFAQHRRRLITERRNREAACRQAGPPAAVVAGLRRRCGQSVQLRGQILLIDDNLDQHGAVFYVL
jgi:uncharacterized protein